MLIIHAQADRAALKSNARCQGDIEAINQDYDRYLEYLASKGVAIDHDSSQTTYCWSGEWPEDVADFWAWHNN